MPSKKRERWMKPPWMVQRFVSLLGGCQGWNTPEHVMNCDGRDCNVIVNAPRALMCVTVAAQVQLLLRLREAGLLKDKVDDPQA